MTRFFAHLDSERKNTRADFVFVKGSPLWTYSNTSQLSNLFKAYHENTLKTAGETRDPIDALPKIEPCRITPALVRFAIEHSKWASRLGVPENLQTKEMCQLFFKKFETLGGISSKFQTKAMQVRAVKGDVHELKYIPEASREEIMYKVEYGVYFSDFVYHEGLISDNPTMFVYAPEQIRKHPGMASHALIEATRLRDVKWVVSKIIATVSEDEITPIFLAAACLDKDPSVVVKALSKRSYQWNESKAIAALRFPREWKARFQVVPEAFHHLYEFSRVESDEFKEIVRKDKDSGRTCVACMESQITVIATACRHSIYCEECLETTKKSEDSNISSRCPLCRADTIFHVVK